MLLVVPGSDDVIHFDEVMSEIQSRFEQEDPTGMVFVPRHQMVLSVRSLQSARATLFRLLWSNRSASQVFMPNVIAFPVLLMRPSVSGAS